jgi:lipopolysaccharide transport system ATP-binding protein
MDELAIEVRGIRKVFEIYQRPQDRVKQLLFGRWRSYHQDFQALKNVSFHVRRGECIGVIGRNGAGKSTLLQILTGTMQPTEGQVLVQGRLAAVLELGSGFNPEFSGRQNVSMYGGLFGLTNQEVSARMGDIEAFAAIGEFMDRPVKTYSSGMQARLAFSVIAHVDADVLIIDEALSVGDAAFTQKCMRFLRDFKKRGSILFVSHDMGAVTAFCDAAIWIEAGEVRFQGSAKDACELYYAYMQSGQDDGLAVVARETSVPAPAPAAAEHQGATVVRKIGASVAEGTLDQGTQRIECFGFNPESKRHGNGNARIVGVTFLSSSGSFLEIARGGDDVCIRIQIQALRDVAMPIVGFIIKDRLGQPLIGGNTYHTYKNRPVGAGEGQFWEVEFGFKMPILARGDYSITAAIGEGTLAEHVHMDWMHDAVLFKVIETSIEGVLVGAPLDLIKMTTYSIEAA